MIVSLVSLDNDHQMYTVRIICCHGDAKKIQRASILMMCVCVCVCVYMCVYVCVYVCLCILCV